MRQFGHVRYNSANDSIKGYLMTKKGAFFIISLVLMILVSLVALIFTLNIALRSFLLRQVIGKPEQYARASVIPEYLDMDAIHIGNTKLYSLGYADFLLPSHIELLLHSKGPDNWINGESEILSIHFYDIESPNDPNGLMTKLYSGLADFPIPDQLKKNLQEHFPNLIDSVITIEKTLPQPFREAIFMSWNEFILYMIKLVSKVYHPQGQHGVWIYQSKHTQGCVRIGPKTGDPNTEMIFIVLASLDHSMAQTFLISTPDSEKQKLKDNLLPFLQSYRFRINTIQTKDQIKDLIKGAGIAH